MLHSVRSQIVDKIRWPSVQFNNGHPFTYRTTMFVYAWLVLYQASYTTQSSTYSTFHLTIPTWLGFTPGPPCVSKNLLPFHNSASHITTFHIKKGQHKQPIKSVSITQPKQKFAHLLSYKKWPRMQWMRGWSIRDWNLGSFLAKMWPEWNNAIIWTQSYNLTTDEESNAKPEA